MKSFYYVKDDDFKTKDLVKSLKEKHKNIVVFQPVVSTKDKDFLTQISKDLGVEIFFTFETENGFNAYLDNKNTFFKKIIKDYKKLEQKYDFIMVLAFNEFKKISAICVNLELSRELNINFISKNSDDFKIAKSFNIDVLENFEDLNNAKEPNFISPMAFECLLEEKAKSDVKTIVLPEGEDERILKAAERLLLSEAVKLIILGNNQEIMQKANELNVKLDGIKTINPLNSQYNEEFANALYEARKAKGMTLEKAQELIKDRNYFGTMLVHLGYADAMVSGAIGSTADTIRPALQIIKTKPGVKGVSGGFFMCLDSKVWYFADCAVTPNPTPQNLAEIANVSAKTYEAFGFSPKVAMLSYSTANSGSGVSVDLIKEACEIAKSYDGLIFDGPIQFDAAVDAATAAKKMPNSKVAGNANVFIFPDLNAGNIAYKAVQRTAGAIAVGPVLQGLNKPINDLSRGCLVDDIVNTCLISAIQAQN